MSNPAAAIAELRSSINVLIERIEAQRQRFDNQDRKLDEITKKLDKFDERITANEIRNSSIDTKLSVMSIFQLAFSSVLTALATMFGKKI